MFAFGAAVSLAFGPGMFDAGTAVRWAVLALGAPLCLIFSTVHVPRPAILIALALGLLLAATCLYAPDTGNALDEFFHMSILLGVFMLGAATTDLEKFWRGIAAGVAVSAVIACIQSFGYSPVYQSVPPAGLFMNKNILAESALIALLVSIAYRRYVLLMFAVMAWALTTSIAAWGAFWFAVAVWILTSKRLPALVAYILIAVLVAATSLFFVLGWPSALARIAIWSWALQDLSLFGHGLGSFGAAHALTEFTHSEPLQAIYEFGIFAIVPVAVFLYALGGKNEPERSILFAIAALSFLSFPLHMPLTGACAALAAGNLVAGRLFVRERNVSGSSLAFLTSGWQGTRRARNHEANKYRADDLPALSPFKATEFVLRVADK